MTNPWVCFDCGARQAEKGPCVVCAKRSSPRRVREREGDLRSSIDDTSDLRDERIRELMRDIDERLARQREGRLRFLGMLLGMGAVVGLWMIPGFWGYRSQFLALPMLMDQVILMVAAGFGATFVLGRMIGKKRFPYLRDDLTVA